MLACDISLELQVRDIWHSCVCVSDARAAVMRLPIKAALSRGAEPAGLELPHCVLLVF